MVIWCLKRTEHIKIIEKKLHRDGSERYYKNEEMCNAIWKPTNKHQSPGAGSGRLFGGPWLDFMKMNLLFDDTSKNKSIYGILRVDQSVSVKLRGTNVNAIKLFK